MYNIVDLDESFQMSICYYLLLVVAKTGFDTAENEPFKVCPLSAYRSPRSNTKTSTGTPWDPVVQKERKKERKRDPSGDLSWLSTPI